jgi:inosine triphosphate pyrophosphatase
MQIEYITSNPNKFAEAKHILSEWDLEQVDIDLTEIQGDSHMVISAKAKSAYALLQRPLIVEDVSLCCPAIGGLPGPYIKDFLQKLGSNGLYELIHKYADHSVQVICLAAYIDESTEPAIFEGVQEGTIVAPRIGANINGTAHMHGWNPIVQPAGMQKTYGEMSMLERSKISMRFLALSKLNLFLKEIHKL